MKGMILSAGLGTRLKPFTDKHPKALAMVNGKSLLQRNVEYLASFGISDVIINVHHFADQIKSILEKNNGFGSKVEISDESDEVLETGGGLKKARYYFDNTEPFVLMNVDILTDLDIRKMLDYHKAQSPLATLAVTNRATSRYLLFDQYSRLSGWKNTQSEIEKISRHVSVYLPKAFSGIHIIDPKIFELIEEEGKFSMIDLYLRLSSDHTILGFDHSETKFIDVGKPESVIKANQIFI